MKSGKRFFVFLLPALLYLAGAFGYFFLSSEKWRDPVVPSAVQRTEPASFQELLVDLNRVEYDELINIPGVGDKLAKEILRYRQEHGAFGSVAELDRVPGIGEKMLALLSNYVYVED